MKKKVLIISNLFHAFPRIPGITVYFLDFGWKPVIVTPPLDATYMDRLGFPEKFSEKVTLIQVPHKDIYWFVRKFLKLIGYKVEKYGHSNLTYQLKERLGIIQKKSYLDILKNLYETFFGYPDGEILWKKPVLQALNKILRKEHFDALISSSPFPTVHLIAKELKRKFNLPWVADFRDLWTQNHYYLYPRWRKVFEKQLELRTLSLADALVTVSSIWAEKLKIFHKRNTVYAITNGFDPEKVNIPPAKLTSKFTITYTGQIYIGQQDPNKLLIALHKLISKKVIDPKDIEVRFYGREEKWLKKEIEKYNLTSIVKQFGQVPREVALKKQWESQILLLFNWEDSREKGLYTGKVFEYLAARRPILITGGYGGDVLEELIKETKSGVYCPKVEDVEEALKNFYLEYKQQGKVGYRGDWEKIKKYSYKEMARKFVEILNQIAKNEKQN